MSARSATIDRVLEGFGRVVFAIGIESHHGGPCHGIDANSFSRAFAPILGHSEQPDPGIIRCLDHVAGAVGASVVDEQDLHIDVRGDNPKISQERTDGASLGI